MMGVRKTYKCLDCGQKTGQYHLQGCDIERCPKCGLQLLTCGCKVLMSERIKVKSSAEEDFS